MINENEFYDKYKDKVSYISIGPSIDRTRGISLKPEFANLGAQFENDWHSLTLTERANIETRVFLDII